MRRAKLCLCLTADTLEKDKAILDAWADRVDLAELRADFLTEEERRHIPTLPRRSSVPLILTVRRVRDGGRFAGNEGARTGLLSSGVRAGYRYLDLEADFSVPELEETARSRGVRIIRSRHELTGMQAVEAAALGRLAHREDEIPKLAVNLGSTADLLALLRMREAMGRGERILIGMGSFGAPTRILAGRLGSFLCYASPPPELSPEAAAGQLDLESLLTVYRFRTIGAGTRVFGVIGDPIMHSFSPRIHNPAFDRLGLDAVYLPFRIDRIGDFFPVADELEIQGVSVTIPHKQTVLPFLAHRSEAVAATGACNTLVRTGSAGWYGENTDVAGFLAPLAPLLDDLERRSATVIGAGGAARSVVYALRREGFSVLILNRTPDRARGLAEEFGCRWDGLDEKGARRAADYAGLLVQTTSVGMAPGTGADPLPAYEFRGTETVYEIVYNPPETRFLQRAGKAGCRTLAGWEMLQAQAEAQFALFTGMTFPGSGEKP